MHGLFAPCSIPVACTAIFLLSVGVAQGAERKLTDFQPFSAFAPAGFTCRSDVTVTVRAPDEAAFTSNRVELQKLIGGLRAILGFECPNTAITNLLVVGEAGGREVYRGAASESGHWLLADMRSATTSAPTGQAILPSVPETVTAPEQNLIQNWSFESGVNIPDNPGYLPLSPGSKAIKNWTVTRGGIDYYGTGWVASHGHRSLDLNGTPGIGGVAQKFATIPGQKYQVRFDMAGHISGLLQTMRVSAAGQSQDFTFQSRTDPKHLGWKTLDWAFTAKETQTTLEFYSLQTGYPFGGPALDNVSVVQVGVEGYYAVLGDSYSAGWGLPPYKSDSPYFDPTCGRSPNAYGQLLSNTVPQLGQLAFIACSDAVTDDFYYSSYNPVGQLDRLSFFPNVLAITLTISGDDLGFRDVLTACIQSLSPKGCQDSKLIDRRLGALEGIGGATTPKGRTIRPLKELLVKIHEKALNSRIFVGGYPKLFGADKSKYHIVPRSLLGPDQLVCSLGFFGRAMTYDNAQWINKQTDRLNNVLKEAVEAVKKGGVRITFVAVQKAYNGHGLCDTGESWIQQLLVDLGPSPSLVEGIHPTEEGQKAYMEAFREAFRKAEKL